MPGYFIELDLISGIRETHRYKELKSFNDPSDLSDKLEKAI